MTMSVFVAYKLLTSVVVKFSLVKRDILAMKCEVGRQRCLSVKAAASSSFTGGRVVDAAMVLSMLAYMGF